MPAPFTHLLICDEGRSRDELLGEELWKLINKHYRFLYLGAESPDLPYLSILVHGDKWADGMHYEKTNSLVISGIEALRIIWPLKTEADEAKFVWLMGYVSHMVADAAIHPIVNAIVGPYEEHKEEHRLCEMTMDSLIFHEIMHGDIRYAEFSDALKFCKDYEHFDELMEFWKAQLINNYPEIDYEPHPSFWFTTYTNAIDAAEGDSGVMAIFRHLGVGGSFIYKTSEDIITNYPEDYQKYYVEVKLPGGVGSFPKDGFEKAVSNVVKIWKTLYEGLSNLSLQVSQVVRNWDLDTGGDIDANGVLTFWV